MTSIPELENRDGLTWLEGTILAAIRTWVLGCKRGVSAERPLQILFGNLRAFPAAEHLDHFMQALNGGCTRMIEVCCTCEPMLSGDEMLLLDMFALMQEERHEAATDLLARFVTATAAHDASGHALAIVQVLREAGHALARGPAALRRHGHPAIDPVPGRGASPTLH
ncbi:MAG: hypothetical protein U1E70_06965 [Acetobacteraceae bacterium]|nr:hypothetical protein [Pseudomonadota bacterium]